MHLLTLFAATGSKNYQDVRNIIMVRFKLLHKTKLRDYKWNITSYGEISIVFHFQHQAMQLASLQLNDHTLPLIVPWP